MTLIEAIQQRRSVRTYSKKNLSPGHRGKIEKILQEKREAPFGSPVRFRLLDLSSIEEERRGALGTYGFIRGASSFIAGIVSLPGNTSNRPSAAAAMVDLGYLFEYTILELTVLGLGTCWLGGTLKREELTSLLQLASNEVLTALTPAGYPAERQGLQSKLIRFAAGSKHRKPWTELFFPAGAAANQLTPQASSENTKVLLECVRLAPSASNKQPWRIVRDGPYGELESYHFFLQRNKGYGMFGDYIDLQRVDMGIALCHFDAAAGELGVTGSWTADEKAAVQALPSMGTDWEYILSWRGE